MSYLRHLFFVFLLLIPLQSLNCEETQKFLRINKNSDKKPVSLDTAIVSYSDGKTTVDLIAAVHIAEKSYYQTLNRDFENYDALLFELVAPEDADLDLSKKNETPNLLTRMQTALKDALELEFQLENIDYRKSNFVHADMTPTQLLESMQKKGENVFSMFLKILLRSQQFAQQHPEKSSELILLQMLFDPNRKLSLRSLLAEQFEDIDAITEVLDGPEGSTLLSERNKVALQVLSKQIALGKRRIGIFYGAGHMPDLERRLLILYPGLKKTSEKWLIAWNL